MVNLGSSDTELYGTDGSYYDKITSGPSYTKGNVYTEAAARSGIVNSGGYTGQPNQSVDITALKRSSIKYESSPAFPSQRSAGGVFMPNRLSMWHKAPVGSGRQAPETRRYRRLGVRNQSLGWRAKLTQASTKSEKGTSSIYTGFERYKTRETASGTSALDPNAGFKKLELHATNQNYAAGLAKMFKEQGSKIKVL